MEFMLDTANLEEIKTYTEQLPILGVTTNPSIIKKEGVVDFFDHMRKIRDIIGMSASLHIQVVAHDVKGMLKDAATILEQVDQEVYIKVPVTLAGLKVMKELKRKEKNVSATTIYTTLQGQLAIATGVDYVIPYFNRIKNQQLNPEEVLVLMAQEIDRSQAPTKILAASFKTVEQVHLAMGSRTHAVTVGTHIFKEVFNLPMIEKAVVQFTQDWESCFKTGTCIFDI